MNIVRGWTRSSAAKPEERSCQAAAELHLRRFDEYLSQIEWRYLQHMDDVVVSIAALLHEVESRASPLVALSHAISGEQKTIGILDQLFLSTCEQHMMGDQPAVQVLHDVLLAGITTYIRPLAVWCMTGVADKNDIVANLDLDCHASRFWHDRVMLRHDARVPSFLGRSTKELFDIGKASLEHRQTSM